MILLSSLLLTVLLAAHGGLAIPVAGKKGTPILLAYLS